MARRHCVVGLDFGTASARALVVDGETGDELASSVHEYRHGDDGVLLDADDPLVARQEPRDYLEALEQTLKDVAAQAERLGEDVAIVGIGVDSTGSTPLPLDAKGNALVLNPMFDAAPAAKAWLWKDHTSFAEAQEFTERARERGEPFLDYCGGTYSSEWFWAKILRCSRVAPDVFAAAHTWCELSDFIPAALTGAGAALVRNVCAAGHKALFSKEWGGLPSEEFLLTISPGLAELRGRLFDRVLPASEKAGTLAPGVAARVNLPASVFVATGTMDAHAGAVGVGVRPGTLVKIMGTSTCDCTVAHDLVPLPGVCGVVRDSVIPGMVGIEAGQSAVGDLFDWYVRHLGLGREGHTQLQAEAAALRAGESGLVALDWNNGNRTILVDPLLSGLLVGQTLQTSPAEVYRALVEATAFGARMIIDQIERYAVPIEEVVIAGGIAVKSPLAMQIYADALNRTIHVPQSDQICARGSAIFAAVASGIHPTTEDAQMAMAAAHARSYVPNHRAALIYERLYLLYQRLHDAFGGVARADLGGVMKDLIELRSAVAA
jgi:L-ribulokinase